MALLWTVACTAGALVVGYEVLRWLRRKSKRESIAGKHVLITGGSEGIGLELAKLCARDGAKVTLVARTKSKLDAAQKEVQVISPDVKCFVFSCDVGVRSSVADAVRASNAALGHIDICIAAAGASIPKYFEDLTDEDFARMASVNYMGVVNLAKEVLPGMLSRDSAHFCAISSMAGQVPFIGYAAYAPMKAACRTFIDVLRNEYADTPVQFHLSFPPDVDTPGFGRENETKPYETSHIWPECFNEVFPASRCAKMLLEDLLVGEYFLRSPDVFGNFLVSRSWGHYPRAHPWLEALVAPLFVGLHSVMVWMADRAVRRRAHHQRESRQT